jgi:hypothetical protein
VSCPLAYAQNNLSGLSSLPVCEINGEAFPFSPGLGSVMDSDYGFTAAVMPQDPANLFVSSLLTAKLRPVAPGEQVAFTGMFLDAKTMIAVVGGKPVGLIQTVADPGQIGMSSRVLLRIPPNAIADVDGKIEVAILGSNGPAVCRGANSPFKLQVAVAADAVYGFPVDSDHPLVSGFVRMFNADELTVDSKPVTATVLDTEAVADLRSIHGTAEIRKGGVVVATFQVPVSATANRTIARNPR